jgi:flap endonuclease-1
MSKFQQQLVTEEGLLWQHLAQHRGDTTIPELLRQVYQKSMDLSLSYEKRNNPPTEQTYDESKQILQDLGVPILQSYLPYEGEALAASLVRNGLADYVASEDTVCFGPHI